MQQRISPRLKQYDYTQAGAYLVTLCADQRQPLFGQVNDDGRMVHSAAGEIANRYWYAIPEHFPTVELDAFVVMPNHIHGVLVLGPVESRGTEPIGGEGGIGDTNESCVTGRGHGGAVSLPEAFGPPVEGSLSTVIRSYKSIVTRTIREMSGTAVIVWQGRFYDHIVRDEADLNRIREYITNNPLRWHLDTFHTP